MTMDFKPLLTGFGLLESPRAEGDTLWFSDMAQGGIYCHAPNKKLGRRLADRKMIGGIAINMDGLIICSGTGGLICVDPATGASATMLNHINGTPISGINDMVADAKGGLYFGTVAHDRMFAGEPFFGYSTLCYLGADSRVKKLREGLQFANGMGLSPDGNTLYVNDSSVGTFAHKILPDGSLGDTRQICNRGDCDGLAVDMQGGIWIAQISAGAITRILPDGTIDQEIPLPAGHVTSLCFGGADGCDLFVTTAAEGAGEAVVKAALPEVFNATIFHARAEIPGVPMRRTKLRL